MQTIWSICGIEATLDIKMLLNIARALAYVRLQSVEVLDVVDYVDEFDLRISNEDVDLIYEMIKNATPIVD